MPDTVFFGVWNETKKKWSTSPVLQYDKFSGLSSVLASVKAGDYETAKENLLHYYRNRTGVVEYDLAVNQNTLLAAELVKEKVFSFLQNDNVVGEANVSPEWKYYTAKLTTLARTYFLLDCEADGSYVEVLSKEHPDNHPAVLEVVADGIKKTFPAIADTYISAGKNKDTNYGNERTLYVREAASAPDMPFGSDTARPYFSFDTDSIEGNITSIELKIYAKSTSGDKRVFVIAPTNEKYFDENTLTWSAHYPQVFNFKQTGYVWREGESAPESLEKVWGVEYEWLNFISRLYPAGWCISRYTAEKEQIYAYRALEMLISIYTQQKSGIYPRVLEGGWRTEYLCEIFFGTLGSSCITPEVLTAQLKYMYAHLVELKDVVHPTANWESAIRVGFFRLCVYVPEIVQDGWHSHGKARLVELFSRRTMKPDGSYLESTCGYIVGVIGELKLCLKLMEAADGKDDASYQYMLEQYKRLTRYYFNMTMNYGYTIPWGDGGRNDIRAFARSENDFEPNPHFAYFATDGEAGLQPDYNSVFYPGKAITFMRSGWKKGDFSAMMHVDFGGNHSHCDDLGLDVCAYGSLLLVEAGNGSYSPGSLLAKTRHKTISHNTIEIDNSDQKRSPDIVVNIPQNLSLISNKLFDLADGDSSLIYPGFGVRRKVLFLHNYYWIVSDCITAPEGEHTYRQCWHPDAYSRMTIDSKTKAAMTHYEKGANIYVVPADSETLDAVREDIYIFHPEYREIRADYIQYVRENVTGSQTFDTVLYPVPEGKTENIRVERIPLKDIATTTATALKISIGNNNGFYYFSNDVGSQREFAGYSTDGQLAYIETDRTGKIGFIALSKATTLRKGEVNLISCTEVLDGLGIRHNPDGIDLFTGEDLPKNSIKIFSQRPIDYVSWNGRNIDFTYENNIVYI